MVLKRYERGVDPTVHRWPGGCTWIAHPDEGMHRASHAVAVGEDGVPLVEGVAPSVDGDNGTNDADVWVIEPIDVAGLDDLLAELGTVAGVVVLAELHRRDAATVADRHDVSVYVPEVVKWKAERIDAPTEVFDGPLPATSFREIPVLTGHPWCESVLYDGETGTLVATEILVTSGQTTGPGERLAVGPYARLQPPRAELGNLHVERVLVGHGDPLFDDAREALDHALSNSLWGIPAYLLQDVVFMLRAGWVAKRD